MYVNPEFRVGGRGRANLKASIGCSRASVHRTSKLDTNKISVGEREPYTTHLDLLQLAKVSRASFSGGCLRARLQNSRYVSAF